MRPVKPLAIKQLWRRPEPGGGERRLPIVPLMPVGEDADPAAAADHGDDDQDGDAVGGPLTCAGRDIEVAEQWDLLPDGGFPAPLADDPRVGMPVRPVPATAEVGEAGVLPEPCRVDLCEAGGGVYAPPEPAGVEPGEAGGGVYAPPEPAGVEPPPLPPPLAPPGAAPDDIGRRVVVAAGDRAPRRPNFPAIVFEEGPLHKSRIRLSRPIGKDWCDMRAVCGWHDGCTLNRTCRKARPVGMLWAWLANACEYPTKEAHKAYSPSFEERAAARLDFSARGGSDCEQWLDAEANANDGSGDEPSLCTRLENINFDWEWADGGWLVT